MPDKDAGLQGARLRPVTHFLPTPPAVRVEAWSPIQSYWRELPATLRLGTRSGVPGRNRRCGVGDSSCVQLPARDPTVSEPCGPKPGESCSGPSTGRPETSQHCGFLSLPTPGLSRSFAKVGECLRSAPKWTVERWLEHWLEAIARPSIRDSSFNAYRTAIRKHLVPALGGQRLDRLQPEHLERLYRTMVDAGARPATAHQVHRTARAAIGEAHRRGHVLRNVAALAKPPRIQAEPVEPYSLDELRAILMAAQEGRNSARWAIALALGLRQGEVLALRWVDVDVVGGPCVFARPGYDRSIRTDAVAPAGGSPGSVLAGASRIR